MSFDGLQKPSFGDDLTSQSDIDFEADPRSLARILENRELSPSATAFMFRSSLTPAVKLHQSLKKNTKVLIFIILICQLYEASMSEPNFWVCKPSANPLHTNTNN